MANSTSDNGEGHERAELLLSELHERGEHQCHEKPGPQKLQSAPPPVKRHQDQTDAQAAPSAPPLPASEMMSDRGQARDDIRPDIGQLR